MAKHVLITGFEPFGGDRVNPSELVVRSLDGRLLGGRLVVTRIFPVETRSLRELLEAAIAEESPDLIVGLGLAAGRSAVALERVAVNVLDFTTPDNVGVMRQNDTIARGGPDARISNMPFEKIIEAWNANGVPGYVSNSAGTYLCNQLLYEALSLTENTAPPALVGFVHLPYLPAQAIEAGAETNPSMTFDLMKKAMEILIETTVPWIETRPQERKRAALAAAGPTPMWIPRGVKEVER